MVKMQSQLKGLYKESILYNFFINDIIENLTPLAFVNGDKKI